MYSVLGDCETCVHDKVCSNKNFYAGAQRRIRELHFSADDRCEIGVCASPDIQVTVRCPHHLATEVNLCKN